MPRRRRRETADLGKAIENLVDVIFSNKTLLGIVRGMKTPRPKQAARKIQFVREVHFEPIADSPEPTPDTELRSDF